MKKLMTLLMIGLLTVVIAACESSNEDSDEKSEMGSVTVTHELGETDVPKNPDNVVVFDFGSLDSLDKLEIEVAGLPQATIPSYLDKYASDDYENVGSLKEPDFEKIAEIDPDLIIISARQAELYDQFTELAPTIHLGVDTTDYMDSFKQNVTTIGEIYEMEEKVEKELEEIEESVAKLQEKASEHGENALIILANDDKISAYGSNSRFGIIHDVFEVPAADENIEVATHGMNVSFEYVTENDPDILYVIDRGAAIGEESSAKQIVENKLMEKTKAYQNDQIIYLDPDYWYLSGGGLESVSEMIKEIDASLE